MSKSNIALSFAVSIIRLGTGLKARYANSDPATKPVIVYDFEGCPFCRKVREALTELNLDADIRPCPKNGSRFRPDLKALGGKEQFPYLIDPNTGWQGYESADIVNYLYETYGCGSKPRFLVGGNLLATLDSALASGVRATRGVQAVPSKSPDQPLELYSFEVSPFCRIVRERLSELEIPYRLHNVGKNSPSRDAFVKRSGKMMVPYLVDPNTGIEMFESEGIVNYLNKTYAS